MQLTAFTCLATFLVSSSLVLAQAQAPAVQKVGLVQYVQAGYGGIKRDLLAAAERMPETDYGFKPSQMSEARTYGAVIAHAADGMFGGCARVKAVPTRNQRSRKNSHRKRRSSRLSPIRSRSATRCSQR